MGASIAWRAEGLRRYDLIGRSDGFRRPGVEMFVEPGVTYSSGRNSISVNVPIAFYRNRKPDPYTGARGDATFVAERSERAARLRERVQPGDLVLTLGAGDVTQVGPEVLRLLAGGQP